MRVLVVYHSLTGKTRKVSELLAARLNAETAEFSCQRYRSGPVGALLQAWDILTGGTPPIEVPASVSEHYDLVIAAGPVWAGRPAPPLRSFVKQHLRAHERIAFFLTCGGTSRQFSADKAMSEIIAIAPRRPVTTHIFKQAEIDSPAIEAAVVDFAATLSRSASGARSGA